MRTLRTTAASHRGSSTRSGWTLVEMLVTISLVAILMTPLLAAIRTLLVIQGTTTELLTHARVVGEAGRQFARDGETARSAKREERRVTFERPGTVVVWDWSRGALERTEQGHGRQRFRFPLRSRFAVTAIDDRLIELRIIAPADERAVSGRAVSQPSSLAPEATYRLMALLPPAATSGKGD